MQLMRDARGSQALLHKLQKELIEAAPAFTILDHQGVTDTLLPPSVTAQKLLDSLARCPIPSPLTPHSLQLRNLFHSRPVIPRCLG